MDGLRIAMKAFLKDLHVEWRARAGHVIERPRQAAE
jgi:hypothetical protein